MTTNAIISNSPVEYEGRIITVEFVPEEIKRQGRLDRTVNPRGEWVEDGDEYVSRKAHFVAKVDGRQFGWDLDADKAIAQAKRVVDSILADERDYDECVAVVGQVSREVADAAPDASAETPLRSVVCFYSRGAHRRGIVVKVGRKNIEIAYVTEGGLTEASKRRNGQAGITRKAIPFAKVGVLS
jgi:hypothetical protein